MVQAKIDRSVDLDRIRHQVARIVELAHQAEMFCMAEDIDGTDRVLVHVRTCIGRMRPILKRWDWRKGLGGDSFR